MYINSLAQCLLTQKFQTDKQANEKTADVNGNISNEENMRENSENGKSSYVNRSQRHKHHQQEYKR